MNLKGLLPVFLLLFAALGGCLRGGIVKIPDEVASPSNNPKYFFSSFYSHKGLEINGGGADYTLPIDENEIKNIDVIKEKINISSDALEMLKKNGFVAIEYKKTDDLTRVYQEMIAKGIPIYVTPDTLLHIYHIQFNELLKNIEERDFFDSILEMSEKLYDASLSDYSSFTSERMKEGSRRNVAYFAVALKLLGEDVDIPPYAEEMVEKEISNILAHKGFANSSIFHYEEDYSQYIPRGHYTQSEKLQKYFMAMMWYGRMGRGWHNK